MDSIIKMDTGIEVSKGRLLISEPLLQDENFHKAVVFLCHHSPKESLGFILNKQANQLLNFYLNDVMTIDFPVYIGGPVESETLHFIHSVPEIAGGEKITEDIYWSGDLEQIVEGIKIGKVSTDNCKFFIGYSGWGIGQLEAEILYSKTANKIETYHIQELAKKDAEIAELNKKIKCILKLLRIVSQESWLMRYLTGLRHLSKRRQIRITKRAEQCPTLRPLFYWLCTMLINTLEIFLLKAQSQIHHLHRVFQNLGFAMCC